MSEAYRSQALKILPWICARCAREFDGKRLRELTVHHRDGDHHNNPPDGSNWELLCIYCHENEHARFEDARSAGAGEKRGPNSSPGPSGPEPKIRSATHKPLEKLGELLTKKKR